MAYLIKTQIKKPIWQLSVIYCDIPNIIYWTEHIIEILTLLHIIKRISVDSMQYARLYQLKLDKITGELVYYMWNVKELFSILRFYEVKLISITTPCKRKFTNLSHWLILVPLSTRLSFFSFPHKITWPVLTSLWPIHLLFVPIHLSLAMVNTIAVDV